MKISIVYHSESGNTHKMAELISQGACRRKGVEAKVMPWNHVDEAFLAASRAVIVGCPTYQGTPSWQMKKWLDEVQVDMAGKLGAAFASQNWPGGGGADFTEMTIIAALLVRGLLIYSGGITVGQPFLHFGAVSARAPEGLYADRCVKLGENIATKAIELFGKTDRPAAWYGAQIDGSIGKSSGGTGSSAAIGPSFLVLCMTMRFLPRDLAS